MMIKKMLLNQDIHSSQRACVIFAYGELRINPSSTASNKEMKQKERYEGNFQSNERVKHLFLKYVKMIVRWQKCKSCVDLVASSLGEIRVAN